MYRNKFVAMVVPAHNESRHIAKVIESAPNLVDRLVIVDDGSTDATAEIVLSIDDERVSLLQHAQNRGVGAAIVTGHRFALQQGADVIGVMGGDGQMDTSHLPDLLDPIIEGRCEFTKGNRFFSWGSWRGMPLHRAIGNIILSLLSKAASGYWHIFDSQNGYTMISAGMLRRLALNRLETGYQFENRLLIHLNTSGARVLDVPIPARYGEEDSGIKLWRDVPAILWTLVTGFWMRIRRTYLEGGLSAPGALVLSGILSLTAAGVIGLWGLLAKGSSWVPLAAAVCISLASLLLGYFMALDILHNRRLHHRRLPTGKRVEVVASHSGEQEVRSEASLSSEGE